MARRGASISAANGAADVADDVWDETLREGTTPAPLWWFWLILALLAFSVVYLILYPGLGSYRGVLGWSQGGRIAESAERYEQRFGAARASEIAQPTRAGAAARRSRDALGFQRVQEPLRRVSRRGRAWSSRSVSRSSRCGLAVGRRRTQTRSKRSHSAAKP